MYFIYILPHRLLTKKMNEYLLDYAELGDA